MSQESQPDVQAEVDRFIKERLADASPEESAYLVAVLVNRSAAELHRISRSAANERKGTPEWGRWAALQNASRNLVLQSSTARDTAAQLSGRRR